MRQSRERIPLWWVPSAGVAGQRRSAKSFDRAAKAAVVLTAMLPSMLSKAVNMEPVILMSTVSAGWGMAAIMLRNSLRASSRDRSLTRTPSPVMILLESKCWTPLR